MRLVPRDYQEYAINQTFDYFSNSEKPGNPLIAMPTGTGKSVVVGGIVERAMRWYPATRIMMLTETKELVDQNYKKLKQMWPEAPVGIYCDGLGFKQSHYPITFGTIGSMIGVAHVFGFIDFLLVDECHGISENDDTMYRKLIAILKLSNPNLKVIGLSATPYRMKQGLLTQGENALFSDIIVDMTDLESYNWFFDQGYLVPPIPRPTTVEFDLSKVKIKGGEYDQKSLQAEVDDQKKNEKVVLELLEYGHHRNCGMVFASGVDHCRHLLDVFEYYVPGTATYVASRGMTPKQRDYNITAFQQGEFKWMINNGILTTGFDHPPLDIIGMVRHTLSPGLWVQMLGRGTRPVYTSGFDLSTREDRLASISASSKHNTLVLDFAKNVTRLGPINDPRVPKPSERKRAGDAPVRICDDVYFEDGFSKEMRRIRVGCGCYNHASARSCWNCGVEFPRSSKFEESSGTQALVKTVNGSAPPKSAPHYEEIAVDHVTYQRWKKQNKPDSIRVSYHCGHKTFHEWVCLEHEGAAYNMARRWWKKFSSDENIPTSTESALELTHTLRQPRAIEVNVNPESFGNVRTHIFE